MDHLWHDRLAMADVMIGLARAANFALACRIETMRRDTMAMARRARDTLRARGVSFVTPED